MNTTPNTPPTLQTATAIATIIGLPSRVMASASQRHFFIDGTSKRDGLLPEAPTAGEMFLASLAGCAAIIVNSEARNQGMTDLKAQFTATVGRDTAVPNQFTFIDIKAEFQGVSQQQAEALFQFYLDQCPIYGLAASACPTTTTVTVTA